MDKNVMIDSTVTEPNKAKITIEKFNEGTTKFHEGLSQGKPFGDTVRVGFHCRGKNIKIHCMHIRKIQGTSS